MTIDNVLELVCFPILFFLSVFLFINTIFYSKTMSQKKNQLPPSPLAFPIIGHLHLLGPLTHQALHKLSSRYGPLMYLRLGSVPSVVVSNPEMACEFLKTHDLAFSYRIFSGTIDYLTLNAATSFAPYGPLWIFLKKMTISELLGSHNVRKFLPIRIKELHRFLRLLSDRSKAGEAVNVSEELGRVTNNVISQMMLGYKCSEIGGFEGADEPRSLAREMTRAFGEFNASDFIRFCRNMDLQGSRKTYEDIKRRYDVLLERIIGQREKERKEQLREGRGAKDFLDNMLDAIEDNKCEVQVTRDHMKALLMNYLTAGTDSSAVAMEWAMAELINHSRVFKKAREEIHKVVGESRLVEESDLPNLPYLQAVIKETLRLHPSFPFILRGSTEECKVGKYTIPKNVLLMVNLWSLGRNPETWKKPLEFQPERFLPTNNEGEMSMVDFRGQHYELLPFGTGRRNCPGSALALQTVPLMLANMVQCFDWEVAGPRGKKPPGGETLVDMTESPGSTVPMANGLVCVPIARFDLTTILSS